MSKAESENSDVYLLHLHICLCCNLYIYSYRQYFKTFQNLVPLRTPPFQSNRTVLVEQAQHFSHIFKLSLPFYVCRKTLLVFSPLSFLCPFTEQL